MVKDTFVHVVIGDLIDNIFGVCYDSTLNNKVLFYEW
jgi:hypothetical protein